MCMYLCLYYVNAAQMLISYVRSKKIVCFKMKHLCLNGRIILNTQNASSLKTNFSLEQTISFWDTEIWIIWYCILFKYICSVLCINSWIYAFLLKLYWLMFIVETDITILYATECKMQVYYTLAYRFWIISSTSKTCFYSYTKISFSYKYLGLIQCLLCEYN